jgi:hypothetical protein
VGDSGSSLAETGTRLNFDVSVLALRDRDFHPLDLFRLRIAPFQAAIHRDEFVKRWPAIVTAAENESRIRH